jgi:hypothetical protein
LKYKKVEANVQESDPTSLLWFFLRMGGREIEVEIGINKTFYVGVRIVKLRERQTKLGESGETRRAQNIYIETM